MSQTNQTLIDITVTVALPARATYQDDTLSMPLEDARQFVKDLAEALPPRKPRARGNKGEKKSQ